MGCAKNADSSQADSILTSLGFILAQWVFIDLVCLGIVFAKIRLCAKSYQAPVGIKKLQMPFLGAEMVFMSFYLPLHHMHLFLFQQVSINQSKCTSSLAKVKLLKLFTYPLLKQF